MIRAAVELTTALVIVIGLSVSMTALPRAKPDPHSTDPVPPVEIVVIEKQPLSEPAPPPLVLPPVPQTPVKLDVLEDRLRAIQVQVNRIEAKAEGKKDP